MYSLLYRALPGGKIAKLIQLGLIIVGFISLLFFVAFPFVESLLPEDPALDV